MRHMQIRLPRGALALAPVALAGLALAACGGSSTSSTASNASTAAKTSADTTIPTTSTTATAPSVKASRPRPKRALLPLVACLEAHGIRLPPQHGGLTLPHGVTRAQFETTLQGCSHVDFNPRELPTEKQLLTSFAACMREDGIKDMPEPNLSDKGPVFDYKGAYRGKPYTLAVVKCRSILNSGVAGERR